MSDIQELSSRVEAAEQRFGLIAERDRKYSERLVYLINVIEESLYSTRSALEHESDALAQARRENEQLRAMLHALLIAIEEGGSDRIGDTMRGLEEKMSLLVDAPLPGEPADLEAPAEADPGQTAPEPQQDEALAEAVQADAAETQAEIAADPAMDAETTTAAVANATSDPGDAEADVETARPGEAMDAPVEGEASESDEKFDEAVPGAEGGAEEEQAPALIDDLEGPASVREIIQRVSELAEDLADVVESVPATDADAEPEPDESSRPTEATALAS